MERYAVNATPGDYPIEEVQLVRGDDEVLSSSSSSVEGNLTFASGGEQELRAEAVDEYGKTASVTVAVTVDGDGRGGSGGNCEGTYVNFGLDGQECHNPEEDGMRSDAVLGDVVFLNNGQEGLQMGLDGNRINMTNDELGEFTGEGPNEDVLSIDRLESSISNADDNTRIETPSITSSTSGTRTSSATSSNSSDNDQESYSVNDSSQYNVQDNRGRVVDRYAEYRGLSP
ncbi:hypothetical protein [Halomicrobium urmianum]|uniref:hypothetical protein n=1 Tax=Halomicrobium urmianum TaxID=1586233 RepID=UPI001CD9FB7A|nr:hypothetical protein [Halomicrobium urmianum]